MKVNENNSIHCKYLLCEFCNKLKCTILAPSNSTMSTFSNKYTVAM